jgi:hypothetical protein
MYQAGDRKKDCFYAGPLTLIQAGYYVFYCITII